MKASIPSDWEARHKAFRKLLTADRRARLNYRRDVDNAYEPVRTAVQAIEGGAALAALKPSWRACAASSTARRRRRPPTPSRRR